MVATATPATSPATSPTTRLATPSASPAKRLAAPFIKPLRETGSMIALSLDVMVQFAHPPFFWREFIEQCWFIARVATLPAVMQAITFNGLVVYMFDVVLVAMGASDLSGAGAALAGVAQIGPLSTVFVLSGAACTAICADLGARTIREEIDAMSVLGINPVHRLLVPRVAALVVVGCLINTLVVLSGLTADYFFSVYAMNVTPGAFATSLTTLVNNGSVVVSFLKAAVFGGLGALIACYKGLTVGGGPQGVGNAVNETVVYTFMALMLANAVITALATPLTTVS